MMGHAPDTLRREVAELSERSGWGYRDVVGMAHAERRMWLAAYAERGRDG